MQTFKTIMTNSCESSSLVLTLETLLYYGHVKVSYLFVIPSEPVYYWVTAFDCLIFFVILDFIFAFIQYIHSPQTSYSVVLEIFSGDFGPY